MPITYDPTRPSDKALFYKFVNRAVNKDIVAKTPTLQEEKKAISDAKKLLEEKIEAGEISGNEYVATRKDLIIQEATVNEKIEQATPQEHVNKADTSLLNKGFTADFFAEVNMSHVAKGVLAPLDEDVPKLTIYKAKKAKKEAKKAAKEEEEPKVKVVKKKDKKPAK